MLAALALVCIAISGCSRTLIPSKPPEALIDRIEKELSQMRCPGDLRTWERSYEYDWSSVIKPVKLYWYDRNRILISMFGPIFGGGHRHVWRGRPPYTTYFDGGVFSAGVFDVRAGKLHLNYCGRN
jgi:hypothetical protein